MPKEVSQIEKTRHSLAHILAMAVLRKYPKTKLGIGPVIENGFYYDFKLSGSLNETDFPEIEKTMRELVAQNLKFSGRKLTPATAKKLFKDQPFKLDLIKQYVKEKKQLTAYTSGDFTDLCRGGHVKNTSEINAEAFKLTKVAGAYWRGSEKNPMLTRIYAVAFETRKELDDHLVILEGAKKRDHRKLGKDLDLFIFADEVGPGLPLYTEKGATIRRELERYVIDEEIKRGYRHVYTPDLARVRLYEISVHYPFYKDSMYPVMEVDEDKLVLRPMSCPHHFMLYKSRPRSYRELPLKIAEVAKLYRYEKSGELTGLMRVRSFCLADSHIFCTRERAHETIREVLELINDMASVLGLQKEKDYWFRLSLGDRKNKRKYFDAPKDWERGEKTLRHVLAEMQEPFIEAKDEAAFYGPKIDVQMKNVLGKEDTAFTVQYDFCLPFRFSLEYINERGRKEQPVVIHRSSIGAIERTMALLIERYAGALPLWLSPVQMFIVPVGAAHRPYAREILGALKNSGARVELSPEHETVGKAIREGEMQKIPYILVVGDKEIAAKTISVRARGKGVLESTPVDQFLKKIANEIKHRK